MPNPTESAESYFRLAKIVTSQALGYYAPAIRALNPVFSDDEKMTMAVDKYYRVYVGKKFVLDQVQAAMDVSDENPCHTCGTKSHHILAYVAGTIGHEASHLIRKHHKRYEIMGATNSDKWNRAADLEINDDHNQIHAGCHKQDLCLPVMGLWPEKLRKHPEDAEAWSKNKNKAKFEKLEKAGDTEKLQAFMEALTDEEQRQAFAYREVQRHGEDIWKLFVDGKMSEEYYTLLPSDPPCPVHDKDERGDGKGSSCSSTGQAQCTCPHTTEHGSGVGGEARSYELGPPTSDNPGVSETEGKFISRAVAKKIQSAKNQGNVPAGLARWADDELEPAKYDWRSELRKAIMFGTGRKHGSELRSFRRLGILTGSNRGRILFPMKYDPVPDVTVVQDTSGSMDQHALNASASEIDGICKAVAATIRFTSVDAQASELTELANIRDAKLTGGGGTDMRVGITAALSDKQRIPSVIIVMTDGYTEWPEVPINEGKTTLIICLVGEDTAPLESVPSWALGVKVEGENPETKEAVE